MPDVFRTRARTFWFAARFLSAGAQIGDIFDGQGLPPDMSLYLHATDENGPDDGATRW